MKKENPGEGKPSKIAPVQPPKEIHEGSHTAMYRCRRTLQINGLLDHHNPEKVWIQLAVDVHVQ
jgi:hypothetical protein